MVSISRVFASKDSDIKVVLTDQPMDGGNTCRGAQTDA